MQRPLALTQGDASGIGPEILAKLLAGPLPGRPVAYGDRRLLARGAEMVGVLPLGPGTKLAVVEFAGQQILLSVSRGQVTRLADNSQGDFHVG